MIERRIGLLFACFLLLFCLAIGRAAWVQGVQGGGLGADAQSQHTQTVTIPGQRGRILDRKGRELAVSEDAADVVATPYQVKHPSGAARRLAQVLHVSRTDLERSLGDRSSGFAYLAREVDLATAEQVRKLDITGISTVPSTRRIYPEGKLATQVIGTVGTDNQGLTGLEAADNDLLGAASGERAVTVDGLGKEIERNTVSSAQHGQDLKLTIDAEIQARTEQVLAGLGQTYQPKGATAIVMNPRNSQILAMANWPTVDPNDLGAAKPSELQNMATGFTYEPGSTFKAFTVAGALQQHLVTPSTPFYLPIELQVADRTITDAESRGAETLTVAQILAQSSNVGAVKIGLELGAQHFYDWVRNFGFGEPDRHPVPGRGAGHHPQPRLALRQAIVPVLGLDDGQPPDRPGALRDAHPDGNRLLGDRRRRDPAAAAAGPGPGRRRGVGAAGQAGDQRPDGRGAAPDARGGARPGRDGLRGQRPRLHARGQDRNGAGRGERRLLGFTLHRVVRGLRARSEPAASGRCGGKPAAGRKLLRRHRGRAGVR